MPYPPIPSERQLAWHEPELYGFVHSTVNTFTDREWGYGDEDSAVFVPSEFDADPIAAAFRDGGLKGLILACKHHDRFCLWPSTFTDHSVRRSPSRNGQRNMVREFSDAGRRHMPKFGVYLSPWARHRADCATPAYVDYYRTQLRKLLPGYGEIFEVWFDGANGGARERRSIGRRTCHGLDETWRMVRELKPGAVIFSDAGPVVRWVGDKRGIAGDPRWATLNRDDFVAGEADCRRLNRGDQPGAHWVPAECDVSIRPGWFYHPAEADKVRFPGNLADLYVQSAGRGWMLLKAPPDCRGRIHENDMAALRGFHKRLAAMFSVNPAAGVRATATTSREGAAFSAALVADGRRDTYWAAPDGDRTAAIELDLGRDVAFNVVSLRHPIAPAQRIVPWELDVWRDGTWETFAAGEAVGARRLWRGTNDVVATRVRVRIIEAAACPALGEFALHREPSEHRPGARR